MCWRWGGRDLLQFFWAWMGGQDKRSSTWWALVWELFTSLVCSVINIAAITAHFLTSFAVSSKLFLSQPLIFVFCASSSPFHPNAGRGGGRREVSKQCVVWNSKRGSTIPKLWHYFENIPIGRDLRMLSSPASCFRHIRHSVWSIHSCISVI